MSDARTREAIAIYAEKGEAVTCEDCGQPISYFTARVYRGEMVRSSDFVLENGEQPQPGSAMARCSYCGGKGFRGGLGAQAHFADGWRSNGNLS